MTKKENLFTVIIFIIVMRIPPIALLISWKIKTAIMIRLIIIMLM